MFFAIDSMRPDHWEAVRAIYLEGIATGNATFQTDAPDWVEWDAKHLPNCRLVAKMNPHPLSPSPSWREGEVIGWVALSPTSSRPVYAGVVEESVYIAGKVRGQGVGKALLTAVITESEQAGIWTIQTAIFPENVASLALHKSCGFREVGIRERIGQMNGVWRNTIFLERRSQVAGS